MSSKTLSPTGEQVIKQAAVARQAALRLALFPPEQKSRALLAMADALDAAAGDIVFHNEIDVEAAREAGLSEALINRLALSAKTIQLMAKGVREIAAQA